MMMNKTLITAFAALILSGSAFAGPLDIKDGDSKHICAKIKRKKVEITAKFPGDKDPKKIKLLKEHGFKEKGPGSYSREFDLPVSGRDIVSPKALLACKKKVGDTKIGDLRSDDDAKAHMAALRNIEEAEDDSRDLAKVLKLHYILGDENDVKLDAKVM